MKKMVKVLCLFLVLALTVAMVTACGKEEETTQKSQADDSSKSDEVSKDNSKPEEVEVESTSIVFGTNAEFPPFEYLKENGEFDGIDIAIAKQIAEDNGLTAEIENMEFDSLLVALENDQVDAVIAGMTVKPEHLDSVDFSIPYYKATQVMLTSEDSTIAKAADMEGKKIGVIQGYTGESCVKDMGYECEAFKSGADVLFALQSGACDVAVVDYEVAKNYVDTRPSLKIVEDADAFMSEEYAVAVKKGNTELLDQINASLEAMIADGTIGVFGAVYVDK